MSVGLKIAVCLKRVPDTKVRIDLDPETLRPDPYDLAYQMNPPDRFALAEGLGLRERLGGEVILITLGPEEGRSMLMEGLVAGADRAILIPETTDRGGRVADVLAEALRIQETALVLCGDESADEMRGETGPRLAAELGFNLVTSVQEIEPLKGDWRKMRVKKSLGGGRVKILECRLPAVLTILQSSRDIRDVCAGRDLAGELPFLESRISLFRSPARPGPAEPGGRLALARRRPQAFPCPNPRSPAAERMAAILEGGMKGRSAGMVLQGSPQDVARKIFEIFKSGGYLPLDR